MLPAQARLRSPDDFRVTMRQGVRAGRRTLVVHARRATTDAHAAGAPAPARVGFVVSKAVGNAVRRNRVKRQLRHLAAAELAHTEPGVDLVVRALPAAAAAERLGDDVHGAWAAALRKLDS